MELIGAERVNRKYNRVNTLWCGNAQADMVNSSKEMEWRMKNIMDAKNTGAEAMVFLCPACILSLRGRAKQKA